MTSIVERRSAAWRTFETGSESLATLREVGPGDMRDVEEGFDRSNLARLMDYTEGVSLDPMRRTDFELALDILSNLPADCVVRKASLERIVRWTVVSAQRGSTRRLPFPGELAREVMKVLVGVAGEVIERRLGFDTAKELAQPYITLLDREDPLVMAFEGCDGRQEGDEIDSSSSLSAELYDLSRALDATDPTRRGGVEQVGGDSTRKTTTYTVSPQDLLLLLAPRLLETLKQAPDPPLSIPSDYSKQRAEGAVQANAWAGKVYSEHEFRNRGEGLPSGLGAGQGGVSPVTPGFVGQGYPSQLALGASGGVMQQHGYAPGGRAASRHVDEYARRVV
ncbi:hypothetical protein DB88DRAFT_258296 [Papiliotrema laurentii]|uniref:Uncharacterized protein n=1 Tax=Papiliotrema laurentii TaxID=5418 RepID=A0AAD9D0I8_PAPLA|nr:hypothetical protein DB88DRAFT_258296 [Papiliotrema laurentii]